MQKGIKNQCFDYLKFNPLETVSNEFYDGLDGSLLPAYGKKICGKLGKSKIGYQENYDYGIHVQAND